MEKLVYAKKVFKKYFWIFSLVTSGQDRGIGRHALPPCTAIRGSTTNVKTKNNQSSEHQTVWKSDS